MSLTARHLEANGIPTAVIGSAMDIVRHCGTPRYLHLDFPLGNPCGKPYDEVMQLAIARHALSLFEDAVIANAWRRLPFQWSEDQSWRDSYAKVDDSNREKLRKLGEERRRAQEASRAAGKKRAPMISQD